MKKILSCAYFVIIAAAATVFFAAGGGASCRAEGAVQNSATPLLSGGNPDPTVCRVGDEYYIATSSFSLSPGFYFGPELLGSDATFRGTRLSKQEK